MLVENTLNRNADFAFGRGIARRLLAEPPHAAKDDNRKDHEQDKIFPHEAGPAKT